MTLVNARAPAAGRRLIEVTIDASAERAVAATRGPDGGFAAIEIEKELHGVHRRVAGTITDNLFASARRADLPVPVIMALIRLYKLGMSTFSATSNAGISSRSSTSASTTLTARRSRKARLPSPRSR